MNDDRILLSETIERIGDAVDDIRQAVNSTDTTIEEVAAAVGNQVGKYYVVNNKYALRSLTNVKEGAVCYCTPADLQWRSWTMDTQSNILAFPEYVRFDYATRIPASGYTWTAFIDEGTSVGTDELISEIRLYGSSSLNTCYFTFEIKRAGSSQEDIQKLTVTYEGNADFSTGVYTLERKGFTFIKSSNGAVSYNIDANDTIIYDAPIKLEKGDSAQTEEQSSLIGNFIKTLVEIPDIEMGGSDRTEIYKCFVMDNSFDINAVTFDGEDYVSIMRLVHPEDDPDEDGEQVGTISWSASSDGSCDITINLTETTWPFTLTYHSEDGMHFEKTGNKDYFPVIWAEGIVCLSHSGSGFPQNVWPQFMKGIKYAPHKTYVYNDGEWVCRNIESQGFEQC